MKAGLKLSEAEFTRQVLELARLCGWSCYHCRPGRTKDGWRTPIQGAGCKGFPDLVFSRGPGFAVRLIVAELKVGKNLPTAEQYAWLGAFQASGIQAFAWTEADWPEIERVLKGEG